MTVLEDVLQSEYSIADYLENVTTGQFIKDCQELMAAYSDQAAISNAISMLESLKA